MKRPYRASRFFLGLVAFIILLASAFRAFGQDSSPYSGALQLFEKFVRHQMDLDRTPGLSIAFMKDDFVWAQGYGFADLENTVPAKPESSYRLASVTKTITAFAVLQLVEAGKINLDAEVQTCVPYFPKKKWPVTIRQLLGHLGGISHYRNEAAESHIKEPKNTRQAIAVFQDFDLVAEPGRRYNYSTYGYNLLGAVIEAASGESYGEYIQKHIFAPLGMENSRMDNPLDIIPNRARGYQIVDGLLKNSEYVDVSSRFAGGGTRSTVIDLIKYAQGIIAGKLVKSETLREMFTSMAQRNGQLTGYGMGWHLWPLKGHFQASHSGSQPETKTYLLIFPEDHFAVAAAVNFEEAALMPYVKRLAELVLDEDLDSASYAPDRGKQLIYNACDWTFSNGLSQFVWNGKGSAKDNKALADAFAYFNANVNEQALRKDFGETKKKILAGIHLTSNQAFTNVGFYIASVLKEAFGECRLQAYAKSGPVAFFNDYIRLCRTRSGHNKAFAFKSDFTKLLAGWEKDWQKTYANSVRRLNITPGTDFDELADTLKNTFSGASFYPDFSEDFASAAQFFLDKNSPDKAFRILRHCRDLYPNSPAPYISLAAASIWTGKSEEARAHYMKAISLDSTSSALSSDQFAASLGQLRRVNKLKEALELGLIALEFHPKSARLHLETGNMFALTGQREKAIEYYKNALAIDPNLEAAKINLEKLEKIKS